MDQFKISIFLPTMRHFPNGSRAWNRSSVNVVSGQLTTSLHNAKTLNAKNATSCCCRRILFTQPDFVNQKSELEEYIVLHGHICDFYPKFHCELNFIEQYWGAAKYRYHVIRDPENSQYGRDEGQCAGLS